jgi:putative ABC transport system permease protein
MRAEMMQRETWALAFEELRGNKVRALLTMLGIVIGSACIVLVVTVGLTGRRYIVRQIEGVGSNLVIADVSNEGLSGTWTPADQITMGDLDAVMHGIPQVVEAAGTNDMAMTVDAGGKAYPVRMVGVTSGFERIRKLVIPLGRYFDDDDMTSSTKVCLLTEHLASLVFPSGSPLGKDIRVGELHFTVIGTFRERVATFGQSEITQDSLLVPFSLIKYYTGQEYFRTFYAQADNPEDVPMVTSEVAEIIRNRHRPGAQYEVENLAGLLETARGVAADLTWVLMITAFVALAISGIGIMNIMLVTVTERTREIGIRKAIGAPRHAILSQFLAEALLISGTAALVGILIAVSIPPLLTFVMGFLFPGESIGIPVSWISVVVAFVVSCSTGLIFGYLPANRAARLHPVESLRYD